MDHLVVGAVLYRGLLHRDSTLHLYSNQVLGTKWRFGLLLAALEEGKVSQDQQRHMNVRNRIYYSIQFNSNINLHHANKGTRTRHGPK